MTKHTFRWSSLAFGALFLAIVGNWTVWKQDLLTGGQLSLAASGVLIGLGLIGIAATVWNTRRSNTPNPITTPEDNPRERSEDEKIDPQPR